MQEPVQLRNISLHQKGDETKLRLLKTTQRGAFATALKFRDTNIRFSKQKYALPEHSAERIQLDHLELHLGGKLKLTRRSTISDRASRRRNLTKCSAGRGCRQDRIAEVSLVEYVKRIHPKDKIHTLRNLGRLLQRDVRIGEARASD